MLEKTSNKLTKNLEKDFQNDLAEVNNAHGRAMRDKGDVLNNLDQNLNVLHTFKDTKTLREEELNRWTKKYEDLKRQLEMLKRNGKREMED